MLEQGTWSVYAAGTATTMRVVHDSNEHGGEPTIHDLRFYAGDMRFGVGYGLAERFGMEMEVPFRVTNSNITYRRADGTVFTPEHAEVHHRDETIRGFGDPRIGGRTGWRIGQLTVSSLAGVTVPFGKTEPNPFELGDQNLEHQHIQFGTGTTNPFLDVEVAVPIGGFVSRTYASGLTALYENEHGYRAGTRVQAGTGLTLPKTKGVDIGIRLDVAHEEPERWDGRVLLDGNLGRTDGLIGLSIGRQFGPLFVITNVSTPVYQQARGGQLDYPAILGVSVSRSIGNRAN